MSDSILKEFFIAIGFNVDDVGIRKVTDATKKVADDTEKHEKRRQEASRKSAESVEKLTRNLVTFAKTFVAVEFVSKVTSALEGLARGFEKAFYQSARTRSSAADIGAFAYSIKQLGGSSEEASGFLENISSQMKLFEKKDGSISGYTKFLNNMAKNAGSAINFDGLKDSAAIANRIGDVYASLDESKKQLYGQEMGLSQPMQSALADAAGRARFRGEYGGMLKSMGLDPKKADEDGKNLVQAFNKLEQTFVNLKGASGSAVFKDVQKPLENLTNYINSHGKELADAIAHIAKAVVRIVDAVVRFLPEADKFMQSIGGWEPVLIAIGAALMMHMVPGVWALWTAMKALSLAALPIAPLLIAIGAAALANPEAIKPGSSPPADAQYREKSTLDSLREKLPAWVPGSLKGKGIGKAQQSANSAAVMDEFQKAGLPAEGVAAAMGSAQTESGFNPRAYNGVKGGHTGIIQWDRVRWPKIAAWIKSQGGDPYDVRWQARAFIAEGRAKPGDAIYDGEQTRAGFARLEASRGNLGLAVQGMGGIERFGRGEEGGRAANARAWLPRVTAVPAGADADWANHRGGKVPIPPIQPLKPPNPFGGFNPDKIRKDFDKKLGVFHTSMGNQTNIAPTTNISITGVNDPNQIASHIGAHQNRAHATLIRNLQSAVG